MGKKAPVKIKFGTPPASSRRNYGWRQVAEQLRARPDEWALVHTMLPASVPWAINAGRVRAVHPSMGFRTMTTGNHTPAGGGARVCSELWMVYDPSLDESRAKKNGAKK